MRSKEHINSVLNGEKQAQKENLDDGNDIYRTEGAIRALEWVLELTDDPWGGFE